MKKPAAAAALACTLVLAGCSTDAEVARDNLDTAAEQFEVQRRIVFINGITDEYMLEVVGKCSYTPEANQVVVICKTGPGEREFVKHTMTRSDNTFAVVEQLDPVPADVFHHRIVFKPESLIPDVDLVTSNN